MGFLKLPGSYEDWNVYKKSVIICDVTEIFINRALPKNSRTIDQMRQSARSCKQNIVEGCSDKAVSAEMCIKLMGVAKGSVRELKEDYRDFLRQHQLEIWDKNDSRTIQTRNYCRSHDDAFEFAEKCRQRTDEAVANIMLTQISQINCMLGAVLKKLEKEFIAEGGLKEAMTRMRLRYRNPGIIAPYTPQGFS